MVSNWNHEKNRGLNLTHLWIVKDALGNITGPYETQDVLVQIKNGVLGGDEQIASYPDGSWKEISAEPEFFDYMIAILAGQEQEKKEEEGTKTERLEEQEDAEEETAAPDWLKIEGVEPLFPEKTDEDNEKENERLLYQQSPPKIKREAVGRSHLFEDKQDEAVDRLQKIQKKERKRKRLQKQVYLLFVIAVGLLLSLLLVPEKEKPQEAYLKFILPEKNKFAAKNSEEKILFFKKAIQGIRSDLVPKVIDAQKYLNAVLLFEPRNKASLELLCLTYFRLWDFTAKSSGDLNVISEIANRAYGVGQSESFLYTCKLTELILRGNTQEANEMADTYLNAEFVSENKSYTLRYFKGYLLFKSRDYNYALSFLENAVAYEKQWIPAYMLLAQIYYNLNRSQDAYNSYARVLKISPNHPGALYSMAFLNIDVFSKFQTGLKIFKKAEKASKSYPVDSKIKSQALLALAKAYYKKGEAGRAERYSRLAFDLDSSNIGAKNLLISIGAKTDRKSSDKFILAEADNLYDAKNWLEASTVYQNAYRLNPQNGRAALRVAQCKWEMGFVNEAIRWGELAVAADPRRVEAYIALSNFLISQYRFTDANRVLAKARSINPKSFEVYRGFAKIQLLQKNYAQAIRYSEMALKLYSSDVESLIILIKSYREVGELEKAYSHARTAMEVSRSSFELENLYVELLMTTQGLPFAQEYLEQRMLASSGDFKYKLMLANIYLQDQQFSNAAKIAHEVNRLVDGESYEGLIIYAKAVSELKKPEEALDYFQRAYLLKSTNVAPLFESGKMLLKLNQPAQALTQFNRVRTSNPRYPDLDFESAQATLQLAKSKKNHELALEAVKLAQSEIKRNLVHHESYNLMADAYYTLGGIAQGKVQAMSTDDKDYSRTYSEMVSWYKLCSRNYQKAIDIAVQPPSTYIDMARCYRLSGSLDQAQASAEQAERLDRGDPRIWIELAQINEQLGRSNMALKAYTNFLLVYPNAPNKSDVEKKINELESILGQGEASGTTDKK